MAARSLALRLLVGAGVWIAVALLAGGFALSRLFEDTVERNFDSRLVVLLEGLVAVAELDAQGQPQLTRSVGEPRFDQPYSGWYWEIAEDGKPLLRSRSLWDQDLSLSREPATTEAFSHDVTGPDDEKLRLVEREITLPGSTHRFRFGVAGETSEIDAAVHSFNATLFWSLGLLWLGLIVAMLIQIWFGLQPLRRMRRAVIAVRTGRAQRLDGQFPAEITPLSDELNVLIEHNAAVLERARTQVSNLAHALKTPLSVLTNESSTAEGPLAETVKRQTASMRQQIDHYLARARTAAAAKVLGVRTECAPVAEDLRRTLERIHRDRPVRIEADVPAGLGFRGERQDLEEMLGNLADNACKWAKTRVLVAGRQEGNRIRFTVDDDGPGLRPEQRDAVFHRGKRLDERVPGTGHGLAIVREIAELYDGTVALEDSPLGGLRAILTLPST
ncbi:MAG TPA: sensor histidine kinase [Hypericibacter adhaerens]|jgi:signal transduction histidine kinase|uniref:histidine kinase n=1 Tax=Hypericibacter adhaerens TaxID=2602016 RepID=A0A5J6NA69_9PROT|nr:sensor histidine kinase [Hypericibacter adhaerens]QEX24586.1 ATPase [Hypericibacter adhaerens]HWA45797.1 sensor histidine kinase [Hypericibacter adhaerens]